MDEVEEILNSIYSAYGTDSGELLGIKEKMVTKAIIEFTLNRHEKRIDSIISENKEMKALLEDISDSHDNYSPGLGMTQSIFYKIETLLNNLKK